MIATAKSLVAAAVAITCFALLPSSAGAALDFTSFTVKSFQGTPAHNSTVPETQAGARSDLELEFRMCDGPLEVDTGPTGPTVNNQCPANQDQEWLYDLDVELGPGYVGDPTQTAKCPYHMFLLLLACPDNTIVGQSKAWIEQGNNGVPPLGATTVYVNYLYNVETFGFEPAFLGTGTYPGVPNYLRPVTVSVNTDGNYAVRSVTHAIPHGVAGGDASLNSKIEQIKVRLYGRNNTGQPFMVSPTSCDPAQFKVGGNTYTDRDTFIYRTASLAPTGCANVPFDPAVSFDPADTTKRAAPSGYTVGIDVPETNPIVNSHLKDAVVDLPEGFQLSTSAARGLEGCTIAQFGYGSNDPVQCPDGSRIGSVSIKTPVLEDLAGGAPPLTGDVFFGQPTAPGGPTDANPWKLYLLLEGSGLRIKLRGDVTIDPATGQIKSKFLDQPQVPFSELRLALRGGPRAILQNPTTCGAFTVDAVLSPWSGGPDKPDVPDNPEVSISGDGLGGPCPAPSFNPSLSASVDPTQAGAFTRSQLTIERSDDDDLIRSLELSLPPGLVGGLKSVPQCAIAQLEHAACPEDTRIGRLGVSVGAGPQPLEVSGRLYLAEPSVAGDAATVGAVIPAKVGPIDLGNVVVKNRVVLRGDAGLDVISGDFPSKLDGIALPVRKVLIDVNRDGFFRNGTSCADQTLNVKIHSLGGLVANKGYTDHATGCGALPFSPKLRMTVGGKGATARFAKTPLRAVVTQNGGEGDISNARVVLPEILRPDTVVLNKPGHLCNSSQLASNSCPPQSLAGSATVHTPLLAEPLSGPVYLAQVDGQILPKLVIFLNGAVSLRLEADNSITGVRLVNTFSALPDVPQTSFELLIKGGPDGVLKNFRDLCSELKPPTADATFGSHSGARFTEQPVVTVNGCGGSGISISGSTVRVSKTGVAKIKIGCPFHLESCDGKLSLKRARKRRGVPSRFGAKNFESPAGREVSVTVQLSRSARRALARTGKLKTRAEIAISGAAGIKKSLTLKSAKKG